ncbi:MAG TPA: archaetidylserine decarboxylase [Myxococcota bacterium]|nr:archaetidylserine decarboxylase [Myxococcota bacterium]HRY93949.1 archaetidylserine decarboxylase [Myxococcota bacterium]HSA21266.1 archaetidylserine decarboxylase [Myxococcota bacterium]
MRRAIELAGRLGAQGFRLLPTNQVSRVWGHVTRQPGSRHLIRPFARAFRIDLAEAELPLEAYDTLNAFFTRRLRPGARPFDPAPATLVSPVDGRIAAWGDCQQDRLLQIKGIEYSLFGLLRDGPMATRFECGLYATLYLSPRDYHRVHAPLDLEVTGIGYMPGALLPVNGPSVRWVEQLYTLNERLVVYANSPAGALAVVFVGAHCVGSIRLSFHDFVTNRGGRGPLRQSFERPVRLAKGEELGVFEMGSTVVLLFERGRVAPCLGPVGDAVRLGQSLGKVLPPPGP